MAIIALLATLVSSQTYEDYSASPAHLCCADQELVLGVPAIPGGSPPWFALDDEVNFVADPPMVFPDLLSMLGDEMGSPTRVISSTFPENAAGFVPLPCLDDRSCNICVTELGIYEVWQNTSRYRYTAPFIVTYVTAVVPIRRTGRDMWALLEPFDLWMWLALAGTVLGSATLMVVLAALRGQVELTTSLSVWVKSVYHALAFLLGGEEYEWVGWPGRLLRLGLLWVMLVTQATYTANLAAFFNRPSVEILGPTNMEELSTSTVCATYEEFSYLLQPYVAGFISPGLGTNGVTPEERYEFCQAALRDGKATAWMDLETALTAYMAREGKCDELYRAEAIKVSEFAWAFVLRAEDVALADALSVALVHKKVFTEALQGLYSTLLSRDFACPPIEADDTKPVKADSMVGLFTIYAGFAGMALLLAVANWIQEQATLRSKNHTESKAGGPGQGLELTTATEGEMLLEVLKKLDQLSAGVAAQQAAEPPAAAAAAPSKAQRRRRSRTNGNNGPSGDMEVSALGI